MTQEQRVTRGTIAIFILSMLLLVCLCVTATLSYFAGNQTSNVTLILGGPVRVAMKNRDHTIIGDNKLAMEIKPEYDVLLPGMGIDMQAIAYVSSSQLYPTKALLRAKFDITIGEGNLTNEQAEKVKTRIRESMANCLTYRIDSIQDGWVLFEGDFYYCSKTLENGSIVLHSIDTSATGNNIPFIDGTFQFPTQSLDYRDVFDDSYPYNPYNPDNILAYTNIKFEITFQAIQEVLVDKNGERIPNTLFNVKNILDNEVDWDYHNSN